MKTYNNLHSQVYEFSALYRAWLRARQGKRYRNDVLEFGGHLGENLLRLQAEIKEERWWPGRYQQKQVLDPKPRIIRIAPFRDRVVHQALCAVISPLFEETFIHDSYACRVDKGSHAAVDRLTDHLRRADSAYVLKGDFRKFFDSIPHGLVMRELEWKLADLTVLRMCRLILASYETDLKFPAGFGPRGLPIGNLTSQWFANIAANRLDYFIKHDLRCAKYIRYMDDWLLLSDSKQQLRDWLEAISQYVAECGLVINPKTQIMPTRSGVPFLGYRVWGDRRRVLRPNVVAGRRRMRGMVSLLRRGLVQRGEVETSLRSWFSHLAQADTYKLRGQIADELNQIMEEVC